MKQQINELEINGQTYVLKGSELYIAEPLENMPYRSLLLMEQASQKTASFQRK